MASMLALVEEVPLSCGCGPALLDLRFPSQAVGPAGTCLHRDTLYGPARTGLPQGSPPSQPFPGLASAYPSSPSLAGTPQAPFTNPLPLAPPRRPGMPPGERLEKTGSPSGRREECPSSWARPGLSLSAAFSGEPAVGFPSPDDREGALQIPLFSPAWSSSKQGYPMPFICPKLIEHFLCATAGFLGGSAVKNLPAIQETVVGSLGWKESLANPLKYSCLENPIDRRVWRATVHGVKESRTPTED